MTDPDLGQLRSSLAEQRGRIDTTDFSYADQQLIHQGAVVAFHQLTVTDRSGADHLRDVVRHPGAVSVIPFDGENITLVQQYRASIDADMLEIPAGKRDVDGEPPATTAARELAEEVGMAAESMELLVNMHHSPGFCDEYGYIYLATDLSAVPFERQGPEEEAMSLHTVSLSDAVKMCFEGRITDAKTLIGVLALAARVGLN